MWLELKGLLVCVAGLLAPRTPVQVVDLVGVALSHCVLVVGLDELNVRVCGHDGLEDAPLHGEGVGAVVHDAGVVVAFTHILIVGVLVEVVRHA